MSAQAATFTFLSHLHYYTRKREKVEQGNIKLHHKPVKVSNAS